MVGRGFPLSQGFFLRGKCLDDTVSEAVLLSPMILGPSKDAGEGEDVNMKERRSDGGGRWRRQTAGLGEPAGRLDPISLTWRP